MTTIRHRSRHAAITAFFLLAFLAVRGMAEANVVVPAGAVIEVDEATAKTVVETFEQAEKFIAIRNLEKVMDLYSPQYNYHGLKKDDLRKIWKELFDEYQEIASTHLFTKMTKVGSGRDAVLEVTCSGHLSAKSNTTRLYVPIDSWYEEVHYLVLEGGVWHIRGNLGESPRVLPFGTAPHPLF